MHYWLIHAMNHLGSPEMAKSQLMAAKKVLTEDDYQDLVGRLSEEM